jgi:parvulin-like peptidyl-prolyl isomerase
MRLMWIFLLSSMAFAQAAPPPQAAQPQNSQVGAQRPPSNQGEEEEEAAAEQAAASTGSNVPPDAAVITIEGICDNAPSLTKSAAASKSGAASSTGAGCKTIVTRAQFEQLANALNPKMPPAVKRQLADVYPRLLALSHKGQEMGLDKDPHFQEMMKFATMQILAQEFTRQMQDKAANIPPAEIEKYYKDNPAKFQQVEMLRLFVPKTKQHVPKAGETPAAPKPAETAADEAAMKQKAEQLHARAVKGEDFTKLQKEAFDAAGIQASSPTVNLGKMARGSLPQEHEKVFDLQPGTVSELISDPGGYYVYKVVSKQTMPLKEATTDIRNTLQSQRMQDSMQSVIASVKPQLNEAYFGSSQPGAPGRNPRGMGARPGSTRPDAKPTGPPNSPPKPPPSN